MIGRFGCPVEGRLRTRRLETALYLPVKRFLEGLGHHVDYALPELDFPLAFDAQTTCYVSNFAQVIAAAAVRALGGALIWPAATAWAFLWLASSFLSRPTNDFASGRPTWIPLRSAS